MIKEAETGTIFNIQRYSINDGPGIRTCVFMKGCPLNCLWCHNPESKSFKPELSYYEAKCIGCRKCAFVCPQECHRFSAEGVHSIDRSKCIGCKRCVDVCIGALDLYGRKVSASEVIQEACRDKPFYKTSNGGITFTGGEPFAQPMFLLSMLQEAKRQDLHTCVETSGYVKQDILANAAENIDLFLFDCKETNRDNHIRFTGVDNQLILGNLHFLYSLEKPVVLRCPIIPGMNDRRDHFSQIAAIANTYANIIRIDIEPYHPLGKTKAYQIGKEYPLGGLGIVSNEMTEEWISRLQPLVSCEVRKG